MTTQTQFQPTEVRSIGTQTVQDIHQELIFQEEYETSCPLKYPEEVANRPLEYKPICGCNTGSLENSSCTGEVKTYQVVFECRPKIKDLNKGERCEFHNCLIDLCDNHYNRIKKENHGKLPTFIGWDTWDAMDTISYYCE